jgi:SAM-dependent methyltransferase
VTNQAGGSIEGEDLALRLRILVRLTIPPEARVVAVGGAIEAVRLEKLPLLEPLVAAEVESRLPSLVEAGHELLVLPGWDEALEDLELRLSLSHRRVAHEAGTGTILALRPEGDAVKPQSYPPLPPPEMRRLVAGLDEPCAFLRLGALAAGSVKDTLRQAGAQLDELDAILDFGCGCGRVIRHLSDLRSTAFHGTDYNERLVGWCKANLPFANFNVNPLEASLPYADESFDLVYGLSVFTHLDESLQRRWLAELLRVLRPGAFLYLTLNGTGQREILDDDERRRFDAGELVLRRPELSGGNMCVSFHPRAFLERFFPSDLRLINLIAQGARDSHQDIALLRRAG